MTEGFENILQDLESTALVLESIALDCERREKKVSGFPLYWLRLPVINSLASYNQQEEEPDLMSRPLMGE
jgi:hypothetical protein